MINEGVCEMKTSFKGQIKLANLLSAQGPAALVNKGIAP